MMRIMHIIDNSSKNRAKISFLLRNHGYETRLYDSGADFLDSTPADGCVVLKMHMPDMDGLEVHGRMMARGMTLPVIILDGDVPLAVRAMQQGAVDFISMPFTPGELLHAIERAFMLADNDKDFRQIKASAVAKLGVLSPRGVQVLQGLQAGMINTTIARWLELSPRTIEAYRATMMADIGASSVSQAVRIAIDGGLVSIDARGAAMSLSS